jgi:general secretion pathway protein F/type IV pilus assembly protein PilC
MIFAYKGIDQSGKKVRAKVEASSIEEAKQKLKARKIVYERINQGSSSFFDKLQLRTQYRLSSGELARFSRELATYIRSGMTIVRALTIAQSQYVNNKKFTLFISTISTYLNEGKNFYTALEVQNVVKIPNFYKQSIRVSESSGILDDVLFELALFLKEQDRIAKEVRNAFAYPSFMFVLSFLMVTFMLAFVVPKITAIFTGIDQEIPKITAFVIALGEFFSQHYLLLSALFVMFFLAFILVRNISANFRYISDKALLSVPIFGKIVVKNELGRFAYISALLVRSGVPFVQTIELTANILGNQALVRLFNEAAGKVVEGKRLSQALHESKTKIDDGFVQAVALGEETSQIQTVLINIAELYAEENKEHIRLLLSLLEPALMLIVGGVIGFIVTAMLLPIFSMSIS